MEQISIKRFNAGTKLILDYLTDQSFQRANIIFVLLFRDNVVRTGHAGYFLPMVKAKYCDAVIDDRKFLGQLRKNDIRIVRKIATGQANDYKNGWLLD